VFRRTRLGWSSHLTIAPQPALTSTHPPRTQPSYAVPHPADTRHRALSGAILDEISTKFGISLTEVLHHLSPSATRRTSQ
jgi:hypothetical protein